VIVNDPPELSIVAVICGSYNKSLSLHSTVEISTVRQDAYVTSATNLLLSKVKDVATPA
jgi:hypothetical protein